MRYKDGKSGSIETMKKRIRLILPIITKVGEFVDGVSEFENDNFKIDSANIDIGPSSVENEIDEALAATGVILKAIEAENEGVDAVIIDSCGDAGIFPAREAVSIPVLGAGQTSMHVASMLGGRFSIVTVLDSVVGLFEDLAKKYGVGEHLASIRWIDIPVLDIHKDLDAVKDKLAEESLRAVQEDGANGIVLGCTGFIGCADAIERLLKSKGYDVPVVDPTTTCLAMAQALVKLNLSHSKKMFPTPATDKPVIGFDLPLFEPPLQKLKAVK